MYRGEEESLGQPTRIIVSAKIVWVEFLFVCVCISEILKNILNFLERGEGKEKEGEKH